MESDHIWKVLATGLFAATLAFPAVSLAASSNAAANMPTGKQFLDQAAEINLGEIQLGKMAEQRATDPAVRDFGKRMVEDHTNLEMQLETVAKTEGVTLPTKPAEAAMTLRQTLAKESGTQFDREYVQHMLAGHKGAIADFEHEIEDGHNSAIKSYAEMGLPVIQDHIRIAEDVAGKMDLSGKYGLEAPSKAIDARA